MERKWRRRRVREGEAKLCKIHWINVFLDINAFNFKRGTDFHLSPQ
jgi:hypothetical protein